MMMLDRMQSGRFRVLKHLNDWWGEFRLYPRRDGKVWKEGDDLMSATKYACIDAALHQNRSKCPVIQSIYPRGNIV